MLELMSLVTHYLAALAIPDLGVVRLKRLLDAFGGLEEALTAPPALLERVEGVPPLLAKSFGRNLAKLLPQAATQLREAHAAGLTVLTWSDADYPRSLLEDPAGCAPVLFVEGELPPSLLGHGHESLGCAVVGTRRASDFSLGFARDLGRSLAHAGVVVVSGLALGVDGAAHEGALEGALEGARATRGATAGPTVGPTVGATAGATVAVLGGSHDRLHPSGHERLAKRIVASGGAVVSEWPLGVSPRPHHFLRRNRVISGLSRLVAVVEAGHRSGSLNTVEHALEQGRAVLVVPSRPGDQRFAGSLALLHDGAQLLLDARDVLSHYHELARPAPSVNAAAGPQLFGSEAAAATRLKELLATSSELSLDALLPSLDLPAGELIALLTELQLLGEVNVTASGRYRLRRRPD